MVRLLLNYCFAIIPIHLRFNPTMVRLLLAHKSVPQGKSFLFQSHNGAIAAGQHNPISYLQVSFNPTMVRLLLVPASI
jgi:hypothetical protein